MSLNVGLRIRVLVLVGLLAALALGAGSLLLTRSQSVPADDAAVAPRHARVTERPATAKPAKPAPAKAAKAAPAKPARPAADKPKPAPAKPKPVPVPQPESALPTPIASALARSPIVVVAVTSTSSAVDELAAGEARAGARAAGAGFVRVDLRDQKSLRKLTESFDLRHTPSVLVFRSPEQLFVTLTGYADKQTVAQAAANAAS